MVMNEAPMHRNTSVPMLDQAAFANKKELSAEVYIFLAAAALVFFPFCLKMGTANFLSSLMNTGYDLLMNTCFYIMAVAVITGALSGILSEFGVVALLNRVLSPLMRPLFGLPGAATLGVISCYLSDNPAILPLARDRNFTRYFKKYQMPALTNMGTAFGMGLIVSTFMLGLSSTAGVNLAPAVLVGNFGAAVGCIVSTRLMLMSCKKRFGTDEMFLSKEELRQLEGEGVSLAGMRQIRKGSAAARAMDSLLDGGKTGMELGLSLIPGVLIISTLVLMLTKGAGPGGVYTGAAYEGIGLLPWLANQFDFILGPLFGFSSAQAISVPITALGSAGASLSLVTPLLQEGLIAAKDIAVFTSMCMCWSGYLCTHVSMLDGLGCKEMIGSALIAHTIGGVCAGAAANMFCMLMGIG